MQTRDNAPINVSAARPLAPFLSRLLTTLAALVMLGAYLLPGSLGHDPWKQDGAYTFGIVQHMLESHEFIVPTNAGRPFLEKPPLYDWVATTMAWLGKGVLPLHDGARIASILFTALAIAFAARCARHAFGARTYQDIRVLGALALFGGTLLVLKHSHDMFTDVGLMAGAAIGFCSLLELVTGLIGIKPASFDSLEQRKPDFIPYPALDRTACLFGAGVGIAFMTKGLFIPLVFGATLSVLPLLYPECRTRGFARALMLAALVFAPFALIWPSTLYWHSPALFKVWFWDNNVGRFLGFSVSQLGAENDKPFFVFRSLFTSGFPAGPLAIAALVGGLWRQWREPKIALPVIFCSIGIAVLEISATARQLYLLPFIAPLALIAAQGIERGSQRVQTGWDYASRVLFGGSAALVWWVWVEMTHPGRNHANLRVLGQWLPLDWTIPLNPLLVLGALILTLGWLWTLPVLRATGPWRGALSWCLGVTLVWGLVFTLLLPWINEAKSYRSVFDNLSAHLLTQWEKNDCMASVGLGESEAPMLYYYAGILHQPITNPANTPCKWLIIQASPGNATQPNGAWLPMWQSARPGDNNELLQVFVHNNAP